MFRAGCSLRKRRAYHSKLTVKRVAGGSLCHSGYENPDDCGFCRAGASLVTQFGSSLQVTVCGIHCSIFLDLYLVSNSAMVSRLRCGQHSWCGGMGGGRFAGCKFPGENLSYTRGLELTKASATAAADKTNMLRTSLSILTFLSAPW